jgi:hypothetical protein
MVRVTGSGAGVDSAWDQEKLKANLSWLTSQGKMLQDAEESYTPGAPNQDGGPSFSPKGHCVS